MRKLLILLLMCLASMLVTGAVNAAPSPVDTAKSLIETFPSDVRGELVFPFDSPKRTDWHFFPRERDGFPIGNMTDLQKGMLWDLLGSALSEKGIEKVKGVLRLEEVLFARDGSPGRNPGNFHLAFWGEPTEDAAWGWRFEGHHLSINVTHQGSEIVSVTPSFLGANPATVGEGEWKGFRNLSETEDLARELMLSLPPEERRKAILETPLTDVESAGQAQIALPNREGLPLASLGEDRHRQVRDLLEVYTGCFRPEILEDLGLRPEDLLADPGLVFEWKGGLSEGELHTYRIGGKTFDIQYANNQSAANHVHVLFRTIGRDFGL